MIKGLVGNLLAVILLSGCSPNSSGEGKAAYTNELPDYSRNYSRTNDSVNNEVEQEPLHLLGDKSTEIVFSNCKTFYNDNLIASNWVTVTNSTGRTIKGIELMASEGREAIKYKINLRPHSSKQLKTNKFDCNSVVAGIIYSNGEYEGGYGKGYETNNSTIPIN